MKTLAVAQNSNQELWHKRMGHLKYKNLKLLKEQAVGIIYNEENEAECIVCLKGKQR